jgi:hypothetical protein
VEKEGQLDEGEERGMREERNAPLAHFEILAVHDDIVEAEE